MKKDIQEKKEDRNIIGFIVAVVIAVLVIFLLIFVYNSFFNTSIYADFDDPNLVETKDGYEKEIDFESVVDKKDVIKEKKSKKYVITCTMVKKNMK